MSKMLTDAINLANTYFKDKVDKGGHPYMDHLISVMNGCTTEDSKIVGVLHDIIEDTDVTISILENFIHANLIEAIQIVSRKSNDTYSEFIQKIADSKNLIAIEVKLVDLKNNMDLSRLNEIKQKDIDRLRKYKKAYEKLRVAYDELNKDRVRYKLDFDDYISVIDTFNMNKEILHIEYDEEMEYVIQDIEKLFKYLNERN